MHLQLLRLSSQFFRGGATVKAEEISVSVSNNVSADIVLAQKDTSLDLTNFEKDLKQSLKSKGVNTDNISISTLQAETIAAISKDIEFAKVVNSWETIGAKTWTATDNGEIYSNVDKVGEWYGTSLINPDSDADIDNVEINFNMVSGGRLNEGVCFNVTINPDKTLSGYFLSICNHLNCDIYLYKFENYKINQSFSSGINGRLWCNPGQIDLGLGSGKQHGIVMGERYAVGDNAFTGLARHESVGSSNVKYNIVYKNGQITIKANNQTVIDIHDNSYTHGTYGFWGNNCEMKAKMYISDFSVSTEKEKYITYKEILTQPKWRDNAEHIVVNVDDNIDDTLTGSSNIGESLSRTLADNIYFIQWGSKTNETVSKDFINRNDNKGLFTYGNDYNKAIDDTANYIMSLIKQKSDTGYIITDESADFAVSPASLKTNAVSSAYPNGRWLVKHDDTCFANSEGKKADVYLKTLDYQFDKPGKYEIYFDGKKVKEIYAHRKPISDFEIKLSGTNLSLVSKAYDLDSDTDLGYGKGIAKEAWYYKEASASSWTSGKLTTFTPNKIFMIKLEVTDRQGATASTVKYVGTGAPVASFTIKNSAINTLGRLEVDNTSYDPQGNYLKYSWTLKRSGVIKAAYTDKTLPDIDFNADNLGSGTYSLELKVTNSVGTESQTFSKSFTVEDAMVANITHHWLSGFKNGEGNNSWNSNNAFRIAITSFKSAYKSTFTMDSSKAAKIPNGCYVINNFGTSYIDGTWKTYSFGTKITQKASDAGYEFYYAPASYSITYNMNGGANNSTNPSTYNVLYGVSLKAPTRAGYTFTGWYDENGNKVTGINEGCNATFSSADDLYAKLAKRTTGNRTLTAKWAPNTLTVRYHNDGAQTYLDPDKSTLIDVTGKDIIRTISVPYDGDYDSINGLVDVSRLTKTGYHSNGYWFVGGKNSSIKMSDSKSYPKTQDVAQDAGVLDALQRGNVTIDLYPDMSPNTYTLIFDYGKKTVTTAKSKTITYDSVYGTLPSPQFAGWIFRGWNTKADGSGDTVTEKTMCKDLSDVTVYAQWTYNPVSIKVPQVLTGDYTGNSQFRVRCDDFKAGSIKITVPNSFLYKQAGKTDVTAVITAKSGNNTITPANKVCVYDITTKNGLSAGCWSGSFNIGLTLTKE